MTDDTDQQPAAAETGPLTESAAATLLQDWRDEPEQEAPKVDSARAQANAAEETSEETEVESDPEAQSSSDDEDSTDAANDDEVYVHGNARTRLRDGSEVTIGELKKSYDEARDFRRQQAEFAAERQELQTKLTQNAQQEQLFNQTIQQAISALQHTLPPEPDAGLRDKDPIAYFLAKDTRDAKLQEIGRLHQAQLDQNEKAQTEQAGRFQEHIKSEQARLYERLPELRDDGKRSEFYRGMIATGRAYGFSAEEINAVHDHRTMVMIKDAMEYRKLQAAKPKALEKGRDAKPVVKPGERQSSKAAVSTKHKALFDRAQKSRSIDDVGALLAELE